MNASTIHNQRIPLTALLLAAIIGGLPIDSQAQLSRGELIVKIDSIAAANLADGLVSGLSIGVRYGDALYLRGYGFANLEHQVPAGTHTVYNIGSITKQFTAAAILKLVDDGVLELDDPITKFLPGFSTQGHQVTIRQLLTHTSGIRSYPSDDTLPESLPIDISDADLLATIEAEPFQFAPGESFRYSNAGYVLLGMIVSRASGTTYEDYLDNHITGPLGLTRTSVCNPKRVTSDLASGYVVGEGEIRHAPLVSPTHMGGAGFLCSSAFDLIAWSHALANGRVVTPATYAQMIAPARLGDGSEIPYGFGLEVRPRLEGRSSIFHRGGVPGVSSSLDTYPGADLTIAVLSNTYGGHVGRITDAIARWALGIPMPTVLDELRSTDELDRYVGTYQVEGSDDWVVRRRRTSLFLEIGERPASRLRSQGVHVFVPAYSDFAHITFSMDGNRASGFTIYECVPTEQNRCRTREGRRVP